MLLRLSDVISVTSAPRRRRRADGLVRVDAADDFLGADANVPEAGTFEAEEQQLLAQQKVQPEEDEEDGEEEEETERTGALVNPRSHPSTGSLCFFPMPPPPPTRTLTRARSRMRAHHILHYFGIFFL